MKDKNDCQQLLTHLSDYIDDNLEDEALCEEIDEHIAECENCRVVVDTLEKTIYLYHSTAEQTQMPSQVKQRLFRRLDLDEFLAPNTEKGGQA